MQQVICQQCGAANTTEAVVCSACGVRLEHPERQWFNRMRNSAGFRRLRKAPIRGVKQFSRRVLTIGTVLLILLVLGGGVFLFGLFGSVGWEEFPEPGHLNEEEARIVDAFVASVVNGRGGAFRFTPGMATIAARRLLNYDPEKEKALPVRRVRKTKTAATAPEPESAIPEGGLEKWMAETRKSIRECRVNLGFVQAGDYRYILTVNSQIGDSLPWRIMATFTAAPDGEGDWHLDHCRVGSWPVSWERAYRMACKIWRQINPQEKLSLALAQIENCRMLAHQGKVSGGAFVVILRDRR
ncbi:MAG: hypothetical protein IJC73_00115 [Lentisphaeria bacterium]|nr:hypothetical protein [Lentisphaeria bacterium]